MRLPRVCLSPELQISSWKCSSCTTDPFSCIAGLVVCLYSVHQPLEGMIPSRRSANRPHFRSTHMKLFPALKYDLQTFRGDVFGGITSAVVGLPIALAFGVASGLGPLAGIYSAIAVGFFAAVFGGTRSQISGPTGPMAVAMAVIITIHADTLAEAFTIATMADLIQIVLGVLKIGRFVAYTPYSVISGFMSGIGIIIILLQSLPFLAALVFGMLLAILWLQGTPVIGQVPTGLPQIHLPAFSINLLLRTMQPALTMALLGSIDSLLTSLVADSITRTKS